MTMTQEREAVHPPDSPEVVHRAELAALESDKAGQVRYGWRALGGPEVRVNGKDLLAFIEEFGGTAKKSIVYSELAALREKHGQPDTGTMAKLTDDAMARMDAARGRPAPVPVEPLEFRRSSGNGSAGIPVESVNGSSVPVEPSAVPAEPLEISDSSGTGSAGIPVERLEDLRDGAPEPVNLDGKAADPVTVPLEFQSRPALVPVAPVVPVERLESVERVRAGIPVEPVADVTSLDAETAQAVLERQANPVFMAVWSETEQQAERELAERIRETKREQRWKSAQAEAEAADAARRQDEKERERDRKTTEAIRRQDARDVVAARKALAAQRRATSPHAQLASLYRHRTVSLAVLACVVGAGMLWSAVNVQHNIAPGGAGDPLFWFSYLIEAMISSILVVIMVGTNKVAEWGITDDKRMVVVAELALLGLTLGLNTFPYLQAGEWYNSATHAVAPVMIGVALLVHHAASTRYGLAIAKAAAVVATTAPVTLQRWQATEATSIT
jgi:hypothetical protein